MLHRLAAISAERTTNLALRVLPVHCFVYARNCLAIALRIDGFLTTLRSVFMSACLAVSLSSCGVASVASRSEAASARPRATDTLASAAKRITVITRAWQDAFRASRWSDVSNSFTNSYDGNLLVQQMIQWRDGRVQQLRILPTYVQPLATGRYVATLRFADDPRAVPAYRIYLFDLRGSRAQITGTTTGIEGTTYANVRWSVTRSAHFVVFHSPYEVQGSDRQYLTDLENQRALVAEKFGVRLPSRMSYYLYPSTSLMGDLTGKSCGAKSDNVGCTNPYSQPPSIQTSVWPTYHEPIHVYQLALEPRPSRTSVMVAPLFIAEGTAVALEDRTADPRLSDYCSTLVYVPLDACAQVGIGETSPLDLLRDPGFKRANAGNAYALSGSFVKYLLLKYGFRKFGRFYYTLAAQKSDSVQDYNVATYSLYHTGITHLLQAWRSSLCAHGCP